MINRQIHPAISVIMPVYNAMPYLPAAVESILQQTFRDFEFIILDDGSTDEGPTYLHSLNDERILLLHDNENQGYTRRINQGIAFARGKYLARQDADDISLPQRLERQQAEMEKRERLAVLSSAYFSMNAQGVVESIVKPPVGSLQVRETLLYTNCVCHGGALLRKEALENAGSYDPTFEPSEDYELWLRLAEKYEIDNLSEPLYQARVFPASTATGQRRAEQRRQINRARILAFSKCDKNDLSARSTALYHFSVALQEIAEGHLQQGMEQLFFLQQTPTRLDPATAEEMITIAVSLAVELGPSGRSPVKDPADVKAGHDFLAILTHNLPGRHFAKFRRVVLAEFYATCAYLSHKHNRTQTIQSLLKSFQYSTRHWLNWGLIKLMWS